MMSIVILIFCLKFSQPNKYKNINSSSTGYLYSTIPSVLQIIYTGITDHESHIIPSNTWGIKFSPCGQVQIIPLSNLRMLRITVLLRPTSWPYLLISVDVFHMKGIWRPRQDFRLITENIKEYDNWIWIQELQHVTKRANYRIFNDHLTGRRPFESKTFRISTCGSLSGSHCKILFGLSTTTPFKSCVSGGRCACNSLVGKTIYIMVFIVKSSQIYVHVKLMVCSEKASLPKVAAVIINFVSPVYIWRSQPFRIIHIVKE